MEIICQWLGKLDTHDVWPGRNNELFLPHSVKVRCGARGGTCFSDTSECVVMTLKAQYSHFKAPVTSGTGCYREFIWRL